MMNSQWVKSLCVGLMLILGASSTSILAQSADDGDGNCDPIDSVFIVDTNGILEIFWVHDDTVLAYNVRIRMLEGDTSWMTMSSLTTDFEAELDGGCTSYEIGIRPVCPFDTSAWTSDTFEVFCSSTFSPNRPEQVSILYPNPFQDALYWSDTGTPGRWMLYNASGQIVRQGERTGYEHRLHVPDLDAGLYFILFQPERGSPLVQKLLKG